MVIELVFVWLILPEWIISSYGVSAHGATSVPLNSWWKKKNLNMVLIIVKLNYYLLMKKDMNLLKDLDVKKVIISDKSFNNCINFSETISDDYDSWPENNAR